MNKYIIKDSHGFSLIEVLISLFIIMILTLGVYSLIILSLRITADNKAYVGAIGIANQKMEQIRNLPYKDVGVQGGIPSGNIPQQEILTRDGIYTVNTYITYYDDPYDGQAGSTTPDTIINDYKIATIKVSWESKYGQKKITVFSKIIPRTEETSEGLGLIKIFVKNKGLSPVVGANVRVINNSLIPPIDVTNPTDSNGILYLPAPTSTPHSYEIIVTKAGYGIDMTHAPSTNLTPYHLSLDNEGDKSEELLYIDKLATLQIKTVSTNLPDNWQINEAKSTRDQINTKFSLDNSNNMYFTWESTTATSAHVYVQKYNQAMAKQWANDYKISDTQFQTNPDIVTTANGNSFIVWQDNSTFLKQTACNYKTRIAKIKNNSSSLKKSSPDTKYTLVFDFNSRLINNEKNITIRKEPVFEFFLPKKNILKKLSSEIINFFHDEFTAKQAMANGSVVTVGVGPGTATGNSWTINLAVPAGVQEGDLLLAFIHHDVHNDGPLLPPGGQGWNVLNDDIHPAGPENNHRGCLFWKIASAGEPANHTFTMDNGRDEKAGHIRAYRGADTANPFDGSVAITLTEDGDVLRPTPSHTVNNDGSMLVCGWGSDTWTLGNGGPTFPPGMGNTINNFAWYITAVSADEAVNTTDSPTGVRNYDANRNVTRSSFNWSLVIKPSISLDYDIVSATGSQISYMIVPGTNQYVGGAFVISSNSGSRKVTGITITEDGTVDAQNDIENVRLFYDLDTTNPYICDDTQYNEGLDSMFGLATNFDSANGTSTFTEAGGIETNTTKTLCIYTVLNVKSSAEKDETLEIKINNPSIDIIVDSDSVIPESTVELPGATYLYTPAEIQQLHYRFRNDDGNEATAAWKENEDIPTTITKSAPIRLRFLMNNDGSLDSDSVSYQIQYGEATSTCNNIVNWIALPNDESQHWRITDSSYLTDGNPTTNVSGGLTDPWGKNFKAGEVKDTDNQTSAMVLTGNEFTEIEYSLRATNNVNDSNYCFRLTDSGSTDNFSYLEYPEIAITGDENIYIISLDSNGNELWSVKKVNSDSTDTDQSKPSIAITENFGTATTVVAWQDGRNGNKDIYMRSFDISGNKLWANDIQITSSSTNEHSPATAIDSVDNILIAWVENTTSTKDIYLQKYDLSDASHWPKNKKMVNSTNDVYEPKIAIDSTNNIYLAYTELIAGNKNVFLAKHNSSGNNIWVTQANLESTSTNQYGPNLAINNSIIYVSWTDDREGNQDIYTQKYDLNGNAQWSNDLRININTGDSSQEKSTLLINSLNEPFGAWQDNRDDNYNIYATKFNDPGSTNSVGNVPIIVTGTKKISETPIIYEYNEEHTTDGSGYANLPVEWDNPGYSIELKTASTSLKIILRSPIQPLAIEPGEWKTMYVYVE